MAVGCGDAIGPWSYAPRVTCSRSGCSRKAPLRAAPIAARRGAAHRCAARSAGRCAGCRRTPSARNSRIPSRAARRRPRTRDSLEASTTKNAFGYAGMKSFVTSRLSSAGRRRSASSNSSATLLWARLAIRLKWRSRAGVAHSQDGGLRQVRQRAAAQRGEAMELAQRRGGQAAGGERVTRIRHRRGALLHHAVELGERVAAGVSHAGFHVGVGARIPQLGDRGAVGAAVPAVVHRLPRRRAAGRRRNSSRPPCAGSPCTGAW